METLEGSSHMKVNEVFIAGGQPTVTYSSRAELGLEDQLNDYLDTGYKLLSLTGPTKSGKTVLCKNVVDREKSVWVSGGQIRDEHDFWEIVVDKLDLFTEVSEESSSSKNSTLDGSIKGGVGIGIVKIEGKTGGGESSSSGIAKTKSRKISNQYAAIKNLQDFKLPLIIDDFHYISRDVQSRIIRALKEPIFEGLRVIILAVPHRAYDALKVETEMTGRVMHLEIPLWGQKELEEIGNKGFPALNCDCPPSIIENLSNESFGSPHLMQDFCQRICKTNDIKETQHQPTTIKPPANYTEFFEKIVLSVASNVAFQRLARGPRQRSDRIQRKLSSGGVVDIYTAILHALAQSGPKTKLTYEEIRNSLGAVLADKKPQAHETTRVLSKMSEIARELEGEPVIDWDRENSILYISDPYFAFYLKWAIKII